MASTEFPFIIVHPNIIQIRCQLSLQFLLMLHSAKFIKLPLWPKLSSGIHGKQSTPHQAWWQAEKWKSKRLDLSSPMKRTIAPVLQYCDSLEAGQFQVSSNNHTPHKRIDQEPIRLQSSYATKHFHLFSRNYISFTPCSDSSSNTESHLITRLLSTRPDMLKEKASSLEKYTLIIKHHQIWIQKNIMK